MFSLVELSFLPHADEDVSVSEDEEQDVLLRDVVEVSALLVGEEQVRFPQTLKHLRVDGQRLGFKILRETETWIVPALTQENVHSIILDKHTKQKKQGRF